MAQTLPGLFSLSFARGSCDKIFSTVILYKMKGMLSSPLPPQK